MQETNEEEIKEKLFRERSCFKCFRFPTCYVYRDVMPIVTIPSDDPKLQQFQPFKAEDIAKICTFYAPGFSVGT